MKLVANLRRKTFPRHKGTLAAFSNFYISKNELCNKTIVPILFYI